MRILFAGFDRSGAGLAVAAVVTGADERMIGVELLGARFSLDSDAARDLAGALTQAADELDAGVTYPPEWGADPNDRGDIRRAAAARRRGNA